jgi:hypothetical protein
MGIARLQRFKWGMCACSFLVFIPSQNNRTLPPSFRRFHFVVATTILVRPLSGHILMETPRIPTIIMWITGASSFPWHNEALTKN